MTRPASWAACGALLVFAACGREHAPARDSVATAASASPAGTHAATTACPKTGHWSPCQVRTRLEQAGVAPRSDSAGTVGDLPPLGPKPIVYRVGSSGLAIYLFPDSSARGRAARSLDSVMFIAPSRALSMRGETTAIQSDNLLALLFSRNEQQRERVGDALTAGPPQP